MAEWWINLDISMCEYWLTCVRAVQGSLKRHRPWTPISSAGQEHVLG